VKNIERYLKSFGKKVIRGANNIASTKGYNLNGKFSVSVKKVDNGYDVVFKAPDYTSFIDKGVSGNKKRRYYKDYKGAKRKSPFQYKDKAPPSHVFEKWIKKKGIQGRDKKTGRFIKRKALAFVMAKSMQIKGRDGIGIFQKPLSLEYRKLNKGIAQAIKNDMKQILIKK